MELQVTQLIFHGYEKTYINNNCPIAILKGLNSKMDIEQFKSHKYQGDIEQSDVYIVIMDMNNGEKYGYFFLEKIDATQGNEKFILSKIVLDEKLPEDFIRTKVKEIVRQLMNINPLIINRIVAKGDYPLSFYTLEDSSQKVANEVTQAFILKTKRGFIPLPPEMEIKLREKAQKENSPE